MHKGLLTILGAAAFMAGSTGTSEAAGFTSGNICFAASGTDARFIANHPFGATNTSSSALDVICALPDAGTNITKNDIYFFDRNQGVNYRCDLQGYSSAGFQISTNFSMGSGGPGTGQLTNSVTLPNNSGRVWSLKCTIPPAFVQGGQTHLSHILGVRLGT